jgi:hypothetical protein
MVTTLLLASLKDNFYPRKRRARKEGVGDNK